MTSYLDSFKEGEKFLLHKITGKVLSKTPTQIKVKLYLDWEELRELGYSTNIRSEAMMACKTVVKKYLKQKGV